MTGSSEKRPAGFVPIGIFFFFGALMATYAAVTLAFPGTFLDRAWGLNPEGHAGLSSLGRIMAVPFLFLATAMLLAGLGWFRRSNEGWRLGVLLIAINLAANVYELVFRRQLKSGPGVLIAGLLLTYMTRTSVRRYFLHSTRGAGTSARPTV